MSKQLIVFKKCQKYINDLQNSLDNSDIGRFELIQQKAQKYITLNNDDIAFLTFQTYESFLEKLNDLIFLKNNQ